MFTCTTCMLQFDLRTIYDTHIRKCIPISAFTTHTGQHVTVTRNTEGVFLCYCSHPGCPKPTGYSTTDNLRKYMKQIQSIWIGPNNTKQTARLKVNPHIIQECYSIQLTSNTIFQAIYIHTPSLDIDMQSPPPHGVQSSSNMPTSPRPFHISPCSMHNFMYTYTGLIIGH
jgi:hypothetical protein